MTPRRVRLACLLVGLFVCPFLLTAEYVYRVSKAVDTVCRMARPGHSVAGIEAGARALGLELHETRTGTLAHRDLLFLRWHCHVEHRDGIVVSRDRGFTQGT